MKNLTTAFLDSLKPTARKDFTDAKCQGLVLRASPGALTFAFAYFSKATRTKQRLTLGRYPDLSLADARAHCDRMRAEVTAERDPQVEKIATRAKVEAKKNEPSYAEVVERFIREKYIGPNPAKPLAKRPNAPRHVLTKLGKRTGWSMHPITHLTSLDIEKALHARRLAGENAAERKEHLYLGAMFKWACRPAIALATTNPVAIVARAAKVAACTRALSVEEIRTLWRALETGNVPAKKNMCVALQLILATARRPGEITGLHTSELNLNGKEPEILFPPERMKNGLKFIAPVTSIAVALIKERLQTHGEGFVFKSSRGRPLTTNAVAVACANIVAHLKMEPFTPHDLRRTAATTLCRQNGAPRDDVKAYLSHKETDVTAIYDLYDMRHEKHGVARIHDAALRKAIRPPLRAVG